jgi:hypothetical protein
MPYPNPKDPVLQEKLNYFNTKYFTRPNEIEPQNNNYQNTENRGNKIEGKSFINAEYLESICMKAVNQSIGTLHSLKFVHSFNQKFVHLDIMLNTHFGSPQGGPFDTLMIMRRLFSLIDAIDENK